jgi:hypothetical protein
MAVKKDYKSFTRIYSPHNTVYMSIVINTAETGFFELQSDIAKAVGTLVQ